MKTNWIKGIALLLIAAAAAYVVWNGLLTPVEIREEQWNPITLVYQTHTGPYKETGPVMDAVYEYLLSKSVPTTMGIGLYFDNPEKVDKSRLRSAAGCIISKDISEDILKGTPYKKITIPAGQYVVAEFPNRGKLSIIIGVMRVYPKLNRYLSSNNIEATGTIEIYDGLVELIHYLVPRDKTALSWEKL